MPPKAAPPKAVASPKAAAAPAKRPAKFNPANTKGPSFFFFLLTGRGCCQAHAPPPAEFDGVKIKLGGVEYTIGPQIGSGGFGSIHLGACVRACGRPPFLVV